MFSIFKKNPPFVRVILNANDALISLVVFVAEAAGDEKFSMGLIKNSHIWILQDYTVKLIFTKSKDVGFHIGDMYEIRSWLRTGVRNRVYQMETMPYEPLGIVSLKEDKIGINDRLLRISNSVREDMNRNQGQPSREIMKQINKECLLISDLLFFDFRLLGRK